MKSTSYAALVALIAAGVQAIPFTGHGHAAAHAKHHRRQDEVVWVTEYEVDVVTVIKTVYGDVPEATSSGEDFATPAPVTVTSYVDSEPTAAAAPAPTESSSSPVVALVASSTAVPVIAAPSSAIAPPSAAAAPTAVAASAAAPSAAATTSANVVDTSKSTTTTFSGQGSTSAGASYTGDFTYWEPALGACGVTNSGSDAVVAISKTLFDAYTPNGNPNNNPLCGRVLNLTGKDGSSYTAKVVDRCVGCATGDLDLTQSLFNSVTSNGDGRVSNMKWTWT